jgi:hypothetical protein
MMDTPDTDTIDTTADAGGTVELLRLMPPTAWEGMLVLGKIATDPKAYRRALRGLHDAAVATTATQDARDRQLDAREKELDARAAKLAAGEAALADEQTKLREREVAHFVEKNRWDEVHREDSTVRNYHPDDDGWTAPAGSGMSRTFAPPRSAVPSEPPPQSHTVRVGREGTTLSQTIEAPPAGARVRGRKNSAPPVSAP